MIGKIIFGVLILVEFIIWCCLKVGDRDER